MSNTITKSNLLTSCKFSATETSLSVTAPITFDEWATSIKQLKYIETSIHWWIGDLFNYGEEKWGEACYQIVREYDFAIQTIQNDKWVANAVSPSLRRETLHYSHHVEVASLEPVLQNKLLNLADEENLTVRELRQKVKAVKMQNSNTDVEQYRQMMWRVINDIEILKENYPKGISAIRLYLKE